MSTKKPKKPTKAKAIYIDWVEPYPPGQVLDKDKVLVDNPQLVRVQVNQDLKLGPNRNHPKGVHFITAAEAHAHASVLSAPPDQNEE